MLMECYLNAIVENTGNFTTNTLQFAKVEVIFATV